MGFMGLGSIAQSDEASDMAWSVVGDMAKKLEIASKKRTNEYNTPGYINVALFFQEIIVPLNSYHFKDNELLQKIAKEIIKDIQMDIDDRSFSEDHRKDLIKLRTNLKTFLKKD